MAYVIHEKDNYGQMPIFIPIFLIYSGKDSMEKLLNRSDKFYNRQPAWRSYAKKVQG